jgi:hypothetical protein
MYLQQGQAPVQATQNLQVSTVRGFEGGLNVIDTDLNMAPKYARVLDNLERAMDGSLALRPGTKLLTNAMLSGAQIVNIYYFGTFVISVQEDGTITKTDGAGNVYHMTIGGSNPWGGGITFVSFTIFNSDLIIVDGKDKPLLVSGKPTDANYMQLQYLMDLGAGTNINTPLGKFVIAHSQYTCMAGIPGSPSTIYISAKGTSGTWPGDPAPNDAVYIDLGPRVSLGSATITGMVAYRDKLLVTFERGVLPMTLGVYTGTPAVHTPSDDGFIEEFGCQAHRSLVSVGDDTFYVDNVGVNSIARVSLFNTLRPVRASQLIDPLITALMQPLTQTQIDQFVFAIYDIRNFRYMIFIPVYDEFGVVQETVGFSYTNIPTLKIQAWARIRGWIWRCACRTSLENIVFAMGNKLYTYSFDEPDKAIDYEGDPAYNNGEGLPIPFTWELPWADMKKRMDNKVMRYINLDTQGKARFTCNAYIDNVKEPYLTMDFMGGDEGGYGNVPYGEAPFGGGRRTVDERLYAFTAKFHLIKFIFSGTAKLRLRFIAISVAYIHGSIRR